MLEKGHARKPTATDGSTIIDPVYIEDDVVLKGARIGPNVSIGRGSVIERSELRDTLIGVNTRIIDSKLENSLIGDSAVIERSEEHTSELQSQSNLVCRLLLE